MPESSPESSPDSKKPAAPAKKGKGKLLIFAGGGVLGLLALMGGAYALVPAVSEPVNRLLGIGDPESARENGPSPTVAAAAAQDTSRPIFIEMPEITVTLPNGGRPRQLRISLALEIIGDPVLVRPTVTNPRVYDSMVLYLRTLRDGDLEGALALDRIRGDLFRRLDLLLGPNVVRDVLITSLVTA